MHTHKQLRSPCAREEGQDRGATRPHSFMLHMCRPYNTTSTGRMFLKPIAVNLRLLTNVPGVRFAQLVAPQLIGLQLLRPDLQRTVVSTCGGNGVWHSEPWFHKRKCNVHTRTSKGHYFRANLLDHCCPLQLFLLAQDLANHVRN